jgi:uncharacterized protein (TIGR00255 family)
MLKSMTGFGHAELKSPQGFIRVEIKTTNHKFLEISSRLPVHLSEFEDALRRAVSREIRRGKVTLFAASPDPSVFSSKLILNEPLAREVHQKVRRVRHVLGMKGKGSDDFEIEQVLRYPDVLVKDTSSARRAAFTKELEKALAGAIRSLSVSRAQEGRALEKDFRNRIAEIEKAVKAVEKRVPLFAKEYRRTLEKKMGEFLKEGQIDASRLTGEVAQYVKSSDISEEITRMKSHVAAMRRALAESGEVGRKIDFIGQEMIRETNTIGSKSSDTAIADAVIRMKSGIEKIREQSQNVE